MATTSRRPRLPGRRPRRTHTNLRLGRKAGGRRPQRRRTSTGDRLVWCLGILVLGGLYVRANPWVAWVLLAVLVVAVALAVLAFRISRRRHRRLVEGVRTLQASRR
ncbi:hypothetical protein [Streptomyces sp. NPDC090026]|uniref:hypothetical protein n=1 Tax=Streptomyces sp. NPDC090026 TaxID=3365923 RepID=UPI00382F4FFE